MSNAVRHHFHFSAETPHILPLSFVDEFGRELDVSHYEISGMVLQQGQAVSIEAVRPTASTAVVTFPKLVAGSANYRVDITSPAGTEIPMIYGTIHVMGRESAPSGADELDAISVSLPTVSEQDVTIKILGALDLAQFGAEVQQAIEEVKDSLAEQKKYAEAMKDSLAEHANDAEVHATADEKAAWNAKLSPASADERYGLTGTIPGLEVNGQSFSANYYFTGNRIYAKSVDFEAEDVKNLVMQLDVDTKMVSFFDATVVMNGIADINVLYVNKFNSSRIYTADIECSKATGAFFGSLTGELLFADRRFIEFNKPGFRGDETARTVTFSGTKQTGGAATDIAKTNPLTIYYDPDVQKVEVENLEVRGDFTAQSATFSGDVVVAGILNASEDACVQGRVQANKGIYALPLGKKTALGADAFGLSVSADGGLQLFGNHFLISDGWSDTALKVVNNAVGLTSTDSASLSFDYANNVYFRTMPNDGDGYGVYEFECYKWNDDSHSERAKGYVDVRKNNAKNLQSTSLLNYSELTDKFLLKEYSPQTVFSHITFGSGLTSGGPDTFNGWVTFNNCPWFSAGADIYSCINISGDGVTDAQIQNVSGSGLKLISGEGVTLDTPLVNFTHHPTQFQFATQYGSSFAYLDYTTDNLGRPTFCIYGDDSPTLELQGILHISNSNDIGNAIIADDLIINGDVSISNHASDNKGIGRLNVSGPLTVTSSMQSSISSLYIAGELACDSTAMFYGGLCCDWGNIEIKNGNDLIINGKSLETLIDERVNAILTEKGLI